MLVPERHHTDTRYRYGYTGKEKDDEVKGSGNSYDYGARMYDPRVGRFLSLDPQSLKFPYESNYAYVSNSPLIYTDPDGEAKILTLNFIDAKTGKAHSVSIVIDEDYIESKVYKTNPNNVTIPSEYSWHHVNITQNIIVNEDGTYTLGSTKRELLAPVLTTTSPDFTNAGWARTKISTSEFIGDLDTPGEGETWSGGGIDFYSTSGEGSGLKAKNKNNVDYVNGDELMEFVALGASFGAGLKGEAVSPHPAVLARDRMKISKAITSAKEHLEKFESYKKNLEKIFKPSFDYLNNKPVVCGTCHRWFTGVTHEVIDEKDITPEQRQEQHNNPRYITPNDHD